MYSKRTFTWWDWSKKSLFFHDVFLFNLAPEFVNFIRSSGIDSQPGGIDSWALANLCIAKDKKYTSLECNKTSSRSPHILLLSAETDEWLPPFLSFSLLYLHSCVISRASPTLSYTVPRIRFVYSQKWNFATLFPFPTFMYLWAIYIFRGSVCQFGCSK
jgi:hypothetical protein